MADEIRAARILIRLFISSFALFKMHSTFSLLYLRMASVKFRIINLL